MEKLSAQADVAALRDRSGRISFYGQPCCKTEAGLGDHHQGPPGRDELDLSTEHPDFAATGLKVTSRLRLSRMTTLAMPLVKRRIGVLPHALQMECQEVLQRVIGGQD